MGTSNWQNISWCIQAIMRIEPTRVLDVGVGFGRWGMVLREFGEVWFDRVTPDEWTMRIEGIEAFPANVAAYHESFYDRIHVGDASDLLPSLPGPWDLVIFGDVIEHFYKSEGEALLDRAVSDATYVLVNLPIGDDWPQEDKYENPFEEHKATWDMADFEDRPVVAVRRFLDFDERPFACIVLSREDPRNLAKGLFGSPRQGDIEVTTATAGLEPGERSEALLRAVTEKLAAVDAIRASGAWRWLNRLRSHPLVWRGVALAAGSRGDAIEVRHSGRRENGEPARDLRIVRVESDGEPVLWDFLGRQGAWSIRPAVSGAFGEQLTAVEAGASLRWFSYGGHICIHFVGHPHGGVVEVRCGDRRVEVDLEHPVECRVVYDARRNAVEVAGGVPSQAKSTHPHAQHQTELASEDRALLEALGTSDRRNVAVFVPGWPGIENSTRILFDLVRPLPGQLDTRSRQLFLAFVEAARLDSLVISGGAVEHLQLCREIKERAPDTRIKLLWHGSFLQVREDYAWQGLRLAFELARKGTLHTLGFVKHGMAELARDVGLDAAFVMNFVPEITTQASEPADAGPHCGLWISNEGWRKVPYAMAAAVKRIPDGILHYAGANRRLEEFCRLIELRAHRHGERLLTPVELTNWMRRMHVNLYVTLSECCPMLPLESLSVGVPCLLGPTSHLFQDDAFLRERLVVPIPDSSDSIYRCADRAVAEREAIVTAYARWAEAYNERARASAAAFLEQ